MTSTPRPKQAKIPEHKLSEVALKSFVAISKAWQLSIDEQLVLLGQPARATLFLWKKKNESGLKIQLNQDTIARISYLLGIHKALTMLLSHPQEICQWIRKPIQLEPFWGQSALDRMLKGQMIDLAFVRQFLDGWRG